jgi:hypothetical protein
LGAEHRSGARRHFREELVVKHAAAVVFSSAVLAACSNVLGFEPATRDPLLDAAASGAGGALAEPSGTPCEVYCATVTEACPDGPPGESYAQYDSIFTCEEQCRFFPLGSAGDESGNSIFCRLSSAELALRFPGERVTACPAAGPGGDGVCGSNCEGYCALVQAECSSFESDTACLEACADVPDPGGFNIGQIRGDSLGCRLYHLNAALVSPTNHCPHAAGGYPCAVSRPKPE